jgi:hypothetical protein
LRSLAACWMRKPAGQSTQPVSLRSLYLLHPLAAAMAEDAVARAEGEEQRQQEEVQAGEGQRAPALLAAGVAAGRRSNNAGVAAGRRSNNVLCVFY